MVQARLQRVLAIGTALHQSAADAAQPMVALEYLGSLELLEGVGALPNLALMARRSANASERAEPLVLVLSGRYEGCPTLLAAMLEAPSESGCDAFGGRTGAPAAVL
jgi:hypothetical protein